MRLILAALMLMSVGAAKADEPPTLDKNAVHVMRMIAREDAILFATNPKAKTAWDWSPVGIQAAKEKVTPDEMRKAFQGNAIKAERQFSGPYIVQGRLHSVVRGKDNILVRFVGGGSAAEQRKAFSKLGASIDTSGLLGGLSGGIYHGGAQASVSEQYADIVANWEPNREVKLRCEGASNVAMALLLQRCVPLEAVIMGAEKAADQQTDRLLAREPLEIDWGKDPNEQKSPEASPSLSPKELADRRLLHAYLIGLLARECQQDDYDALGKCANKAWDRFSKLPNNSPDVRKVRERMEQDLNIKIPLSPMTPQDAQNSRDTVRAVQTALQQDGLFKGSVDGLWGPMTQRAVTSYQQKNNLPTTGQLDQATLQALNVAPTG